MLCTAVFAWHGWSPDEGTLCCVGMSFMPESPRWQYAKGQQAEAQAGAVKLWGQSGPDQLSEGELLHLLSVLFGY